MTDRELLELAAKAAGIKWQSYHMSRGLCLADPKSGMVITQMWNPLTDDGDALRLAVKLHLNIFIGREATGITDGEVPLRKLASKVEVHLEDPYAATRRAITRAAAEIGKTLDK